MNEHDDYQSVSFGLVSRSFTANVLEVDRGIEVNVTNDVNCGNLKYAGFKGADTADAIINRLNKKLLSAQATLEEEIRMENFTEQQCERKQALMLG